MSDITERVQRIIEEKLGVDASEVKPEATFTMIWVPTLWILLS